MKPDLGGYAHVTEDGENIHVRGQYGISATIPIKDVEKVLSMFNLNMKEKYGESMDALTLRQITGSSGPSHDFAEFFTLNV